MTSLQSEVLSDSEVPTAGELLTEIDLSNMGRGRPSNSPPVTVEVIRPLTLADLPFLLDRAVPAISEGPRTPMRLRHSHHQLARLIAQGVEQAEISLITGYSPAYISNIQNDPTMAELIATYVGQRELAFVDVLERMRSLGLTCLEELQERIALQPEKWSHREMMELAELLIIKPQRVGTPVQQQGASAAVSINVKFVKSDSDSAMIDVTPR